MARSRLTETQIRDEDLLTEEEHLAVDHSTVSGIVTSFLDLSDTPDSYYANLYLRSTSSGVEWATVSGGSNTGTTVYYGTGAPSSLLGDDYDYYLDINTLNLYCKDSLTSTDFLPPDGTGVSASASDYRTPDLACDNDSNTYWTTKNFTDPSWWAVDLGSGNEEIAIAYSCENINSSEKDMELYGSNASSPTYGTDTDWTLLSQDQHGQNNNREQFNFTNSTAYRYYKIKLLNRWSAVYHAVKEFEIMKGSYDWAVCADLDPEPDLIDLGDTPSSYDSGKYLKSTSDGTEWSEASIDLSDYVTWDFGAETISGTGDIYCNDIHTSSGTVYIGELKLSTDGQKLLVNDNEVSGTSDVETLLDLTDTPSIYDADKYLKSTASGTEWSTVAAGGTSGYTGDIYVVTASSVAGLTSSGCNPYNFNFGDSNVEINELEFENGLLTSVTQIVT
jgi:hypothetical protein